MDSTEEPLQQTQTEKENQRQASSSHTQQVCRFFSQGRFCQFGKRCRFLHQRGVESRSHLAANSDVSKCEKQEEDIKSDAQDSKQDHGASEGLKLGGVGQQTSQIRRAAPSMRKKDRARVPCRYFLSGHCVMEDRCRFWHPEQVPPLGDDVPPGPGPRPRPASRPAAAKEEVRLNEMTPEIGRQLRETEISQLAKRFPKDQLIIQEREDGQLTYYRVTVQPTDPDWPFDLKDIDLMVNFPPSYPKEVFTLEVPEDQDLPSVMGSHVCQASRDWIQAKHATNELLGKVELLFRPFLRWLDRNLERLLTEGARLLKRDIDAERSGIEFVPYQRLQAAAGSDRPADTPEPCGSGGEEGHDSTDSRSDSEESEEAGGNGEGCDEEAAGHAVENMRSGEPRKGTEVKLMGLQLGEGTATVTASQITVSLQCNRCKVTADLTVRGELPCAAQCEKCSSGISAAFRPGMLHRYSDVLGYLDLTAAVPVDLVLQDCQLLVGCLDCSQEGPLQNVSYGQNKEVNCQHCHSKLSILVESTRFQYIQPRSRSQAGHGDGLQHRQKRYPRDPAVQPGKQLPAKGTCKHYKQSHRWLRFPCCGRAYPCDLCHDEDQDHEMELATRMICGYCAKEQPYSNAKPCVSCGSMMTRGFQSSHWEGGQGCRNKAKMSRNDRQKYTNVAKTVSRKARSVQN
uniref:Nucleoporin NUP42 n=1 Tax=Lepisosteus oculatus TaxID=7918 RepID=W5NBR4_LEPOC|nr:PREDICTED: uncharacterized protein LOC102698197 [Lepisosteus oculatus]XP_015199238.1 PREDICTED: uncharacterized protein LOC102698197 [Lepisosteus oculatus]